MQTIYHKAVDKFGKKHQIGVLIEEAAEMIAAGAQMIVRGRDKEDEFVDEIADVQIMLEQMKVIYGEDRIDAAMTKKLKKLEKYLLD